MSDYETRMFVAGDTDRFALHARNTVTGETRTVSVYAANATAAYAAGFGELDAESGDRSWCFDGFVSESGAKGGVADAG